MTRRQWLILGSLALVIVTLFGALVYVLLTAPSGTSAPLIPLQKTFAVPVAAVTARSAFGLAQQEALKWREDVCLTSASASWPNATVDMFREPVPWVFQFYSPSAGQVNVVFVEGGAARSLRQSYAPYTLSSIPVETWGEDSPQALADWLNAGGGRFLRSHTLVTVHMALRRDEKSDRAVWFITGLDSNGKDAFSHAVKAGP